MNAILKTLDRTFLIRFALAVIMVMHGVPSFLDMSVLEFGEGLQEDFGFLGTPLAIGIKLTHVISVVVLLINRYVKIFSVLNIIVLIAGIIMVHGAHGWYVVGGGSNGIEYNFLLIFCFLSLLFPDGLVKSQAAKS